MAAKKTKKLSPAQTETLATLVKKGSGRFIDRYKPVLKLIDLGFARIKRTPRSASSRWNPPLRVGSTTKALLNSHERAHPSRHGAGGDLRSRGFGR